MRLTCTPQARAQLHVALVRMRSALDILDQIAAPGEIGALIDLAISKLETLLRSDEECPTRVQAMIAEIERELAAIPAAGKPPPPPWPTKPV